MVHGYLHHDRTTQKKPISASIHLSFSSLFFSFQWQSNYLEIQQQKKKEREIENCDGNESYAVVNVLKCLTTMYDIV